MGIPSTRHACKESWYIFESKYPVQEDEYNDHDSLQAQFLTIRDTLRTKLIVFFELEGEKAQISGLQFGHPSFAS